MRGKLGIIKTYGESPTFVLLNKEGKVITAIDITNWLYPKLGIEMDLYISDKYFQVADETYKE